MKQDGKLTLTGILMIVALFYGGFVAVKIISANVMKTQIAKEVKERLAFIRGTDLTEQDAIQEVIVIMKQHDIIFDDKDKGAVVVNIDRSKGRMSFQLSYDVESNLIFTTYKKSFTIKDEITSYR